MNKILIAILALSAWTFAARLTVRVKGVETAYYLHDGDKLSFSSGHDTLYYETTQKTMAFVLSDVQRLKFDTVGGSIGTLNVATTSGSSVIKPGTAGAILFVNETQIASATDTNDWDGDGLSNYDEAVVWGTDPLNVDCDGDGRSDAYEANNGTNPLVADLPAFSVRILQAPYISLNTTTSTSQTTSSEVTTGYSTTQSTSTSYTNSNTYSLDAGWSLSVSEGVEAGTEGCKVTASYTAGISGSYSYSTTSEQSRESSIETQKSYESTSGQEWTNGTDQTGGIAHFSVSLKNTGDVAVNLASVGFNIYVHGNNKWKILSGLVPDASISGKIAKGDSVVVSLVSSNLQNDDIKTILSGDALTCQLSSIAYTYQDANAVTYDGTSVSTNVANKDARVVLDYGPTGKLPSVEKRVATQFLKNPNATSSSDYYYTSTVSDVLNALNLSWTSDSTEALVGISGVENSEAIHAYWFAIRTRQTSSTDTTKVTRAWRNFNPQNISILPGDNLELLYTADADKDSLPDYLEALYGTSDNDTDSDKDGISDYHEVMGWKHCQYTAAGCSVSGADTVTWFTDPKKKDTDNDNVSDLLDSDPVRSSLLPDSLAGVDSLRYYEDTETTPRFSWTPSTAFSDTLKGGASYLPALRVFLKRSTQKLNVVANGTTLSVTYATDSASNRPVAVVDFASKLNRVDNKLVFRSIAEDGTHSYLCSLQVRSDLLQPTNLKLGKDDARTAIYVKFTDRSSLDKRIKGYYIVRSLNNSTLASLTLGDMTSAPTTISGASLFTQATTGSSCSYKDAVGGGSPYYSYRVFSYTTEVTSGTTYYKFSGTSETKMRAVGRISIHVKIPSYGGNDANCSGDDNCDEQINARITDNGTVEYSESVSSASNGVGYGGSGNSLFLNYAYSDAVGLIDFGAEGLKDTFWITAQNDKYGTVSGIWSYDSMAADLNGTKCAGSVTCPKNDYSSYASPVMGASYSSGDYNGKGLGTAYEVNDGSYNFWIISNPLTNTNHAVTNFNVYSYYTWIGDDDEY